MSAVPPGLICDPVRFPALKRRAIFKMSLRDAHFSGKRHADVMRAVTEIKAEGEPADDGSGRSENDRRSGFSLFFHRQRT